MIMNLSPYSNGPVTASFVTVTSTAKGLSKSSFRKMKRDCGPDDQPHFSADKRGRFVIRFCQRCVAFISSKVPVFFLKIYMNLDAAVMVINEEEARGLFEEAESHRGKGGEREREKKVMSCLFGFCHIYKNKQEESRTKLSLVV